MSRDMENDEQNTPDNAEEVSQIEKERREATAALNDLARTAIAKLVEDLLGAGASWTDRHNGSHPLKLCDILIMAPYNAQVLEIQRRIPGANVGTVDKFQGREKPVAIYSLTTSSHADAPRGMEFLYSLNRLNVATSRARCVSILVGSPDVFEAECKTPRQMQLANAFCRFLEMANATSPNS